MTLMGVWRAAIPDLFSYPPGKIFAGMFQSAFVGVMHIEQSAWNVNTSSFPRKMHTDVDDDDIVCSPLPSCLCGVPESDLDERSSLQNGFKN